MVAMADRAMALMPSADARGSLAEEVVQDLRRKDRDLYDHLFDKFNFKNVKVSEVGEVRATLPSVIGWNDGRVGPGDCAVFVAGGGDAVSPCWLPAPSLILGTSS